MNIFNIDEVIYHLSTICHYPQLILLCQINKKYYHIFNHVIDNYDKRKMLNDLSITTHIHENYKFNIKNFTINQFNQFNYPRFLIRAQYDLYRLNGDVTLIYGKDIIILNATYRIFQTGECTMYRDNIDIFMKDYKLLLMTLKYM